MVGKGSSVAVGEVTRVVVSADEAAALGFSGVPELRTVGDGVRFKALVGVRVAGPEVDVGAAVVAIPG